MSEVVAQSQAGPIEKIPNLKKRQRSIYYRPDGKGGYLPTRPLPSDANGRELYLSKGFQLKPPVNPTDTIPVAADPEKEILLAENARLREQLAAKPTDRMAAARAAKVLKNQAKQ